MLRELPMQSTDICYATSGKANIVRLTVCS